MLCPNCNAHHVKEDVYCRQCGVDLKEPSKSIVMALPRLPAVVQKSPLVRRVAAGMGALAFGVGIELVRRSLLIRLAKPPRSSQIAHAIDSALPTMHGVKELLFPRNEKPLKPPKKGYRVHETIIVVRRESWSEK